MTPQSPFTVVAVVAPGREASLRLLLDTMNDRPGMANPENALVPFSFFEQLHFARFALLDDSTLGDLEVFGLPRPKLPPLYLAFVGECDGPVQALFEELVERAGSGLRRIFSHCKEFDGSSHARLLAWLLAHDLPVGANYVNRIGRTVRQVLEESALQKLLSASAPRDPAVDARAVRRQLLAHVNAERAAGRLALTPAAPTPLEWQLRNALHLVGVPLVGLLLLPLWIVLLPPAVVLLRSQEESDPEYFPRPGAAEVLAMQRLEDHDVSNSFTALGAVKPGWFRRALVPLVLLAIDYACRHVFGRGHLARIQTIHFARWVFMDERRRVLFCSNYDGSHESYMDDFINKAAWGLNVVFSNGFGWPRTRWLISGGARHEMHFKYYQRRHQLPTQVWYKAYPGLTLGDLERNRRIREGVEAGEMSERQALAWLRLL
ncbi:MAG: hypothetical protein JSS56_01895 [Proteobacteria bacterium]|nr:hypothetical protein [Pseudomonadota bacterium]